MPSPAFTARLRAIVGPEACLTRPEELFTYECDGLTLGGIRPAAVVLPASTDELAEVVRCCCEFERNFVPRGAGTGLSGGAHPSEGAVVISCTRMNRILEIRPEDRIAVVQPGVVNIDISRAAEPYGLMYAPDPSSQQACTIGGNVAENSGGPHTLKYGVTSDHVRALEVVLPSGERVRLGSEEGFSPGYDLVAIMVGSEGTLGIVSEITVNLEAIPEATETLLLIFDDVVSACRAVERIIRSGMVPAALEIIDQRTIAAVEDSVYAAGLPRDAGAVLIAELDGVACALPPQIERIQALAKSEGARRVSIARDDAERALFWRARKGSFGAMGRLAPDLYVHDAVVPRSRAAEVIAEVCAIGDRYGLTLSNVFHAGDGNLHPNISFDRRNEDELARVIAAGTEILETCVAAGGVVTGEHGVGVEKRDYIGLVFGEADLEVMTRVRDAFNPDARCNPGKIFPTTRFCVESGAKAPGYDRVPLA